MKTQPNPLAGMSDERIAQLAQDECKRVEELCAGLDTIESFRIRHTAALVASHRRLTEQAVRLTAANKDARSTVSNLKAQVTDLQAQLDRANARIDEQDESITELCEQSEDDAAGLVIAEVKLATALQPPTPPARWSAA